MCNYFVGIDIDRDKDGRIIKIHQTAYINKLIKRFRMEKAKGISISIDPNVKLSRQMSPSTDAEKKCKSKIPYRELIGSLRFLANVII